MQLVFHSHLFISLRYANETGSRVSTIVNRLDVFSYQIWLLHVEGKGASTENVFDCFLACTLLYMARTQVCFSPSDCFFFLQRFLVRSLVSAVRRFVSDPVYDEVGCHFSLNSPRSRGIQRNATQIGIHGWDSCGWKKYTKIRTWRTFSGLGALRFVFHLTKTLFFVRSWKQNLWE